jgi:protein-L-isoaspartate(D-aspartate) O-methyltransferase
VRRAPPSLRPAPFRCAPGFLPAALLGMLCACQERKVPVSMEESSPSAPDAFQERVAEREGMVAAQLAERDIHDPRVLAALRRVPRHRFVPAELAAQAYEDRPLPIGQEQTISQPYIVAFMSQAVALRGDERVLEVGTGSGYQAAVLAELAREVFTIELLAPLAARARETLEALGYAQVHVRAGDGYQGWPEAAPFDAIVVTAAPEHVPAPLLAQLAPGGRLIVPVGGAEQELVLVRRTADGFAEERLLPVRFVPLLGPSVRPR